MTRDGFLVVYLAGKMSGLTHEEMSEWRTKATNLLIDACCNTYTRVIVNNPVEYYNFEEPIHQSEKEVMDFDLHLVQQSDVVLVNLDGLDSSIGTSIELYACSKMGIPVIAFGSDKNYWAVHPWVSTCISRKEDSLEGAVNYLRDFYMR